jgi:hypothetical protein
LCRRLFSSAKHKQAKQAKPANPAKQANKPSQAKHKINILQLVRVHVISAHYRDYFDGTIADDDLMVKIRQQGCNH